ncbi:hypothetical protein UP09_32410 [Bradyrhizobium sp. LTSP885]|uniref:FHA domain-containing protein n=1 Tax=Bradyrhizobium sp. LTSP885 TaxID=1619232 RepID=UPI0005C8AB3A|nr:FHA domain-containing protein [Bradyrhizobium sp. LTSP885]KJC35877.1 hypothetical protein UP09_32410 [Bradyrhizobium sp. LTSP885]
MIWIEVLSRHRELATRVRVTASEARIGRGYDNDVIVDDPYVAPNHLRIFRDDAGQLIAEDLGSVNGIFLDGSDKRSARVVVDGEHPIRIGQTLLRVRSADHAVAPERIAPPEARLVPGVLVAALGITVLGLYALTVWLAQTAEVRASDYLTPLLWIIVAVILWAGLWALLSRVFSGRSHFMRNLLIALGGTLALAAYNEIARVLAFSFTAPSATAYQYAAAWTIVAVICFLHLRQIGHTRLWLKGVIVATVLATAIAAQTLQRSEAFSIVGRQGTVHVLLPPSFRAVPVREEAAFFRAVGDLKDKIDADRKDAKPAEAGGR